MIFDPPTFLLIHVALSVLGILSGLVVVGGLMAGIRFERWIVIYFITTVLTSVTGFGFPFVTLLPPHLFEILSLLALPVAIAALYWKQLAGKWRPAFVIATVFALYLNFFVLVAQLLAKIPALAAMAPTPQAPVFAVCQGVVLLIFIGIGWAAVKGMRGGRTWAG